MVESGQCKKLPDDTSVFINFKKGVIGLGFLLGDEYFQVQPSVSILTPLFEIGIQTEFPLQETNADFLYLMVVDRHESPGKEKKIYCFDLAGQSIEILPSRQYYPLRIIVTSREMRVYQSTTEIIRYETQFKDRHILVVDATDGRIENIEIRPLVKFPERRITKPEPLLKYCRETFQKRSWSFWLVCPTDILESFIGVIPWIVSHINPALGLATSWLIYGLTVITIGRAAWKKSDFRLLILFILFTTWILLMAVDIWPYALL